MLRAYSAVTTCLSVRPSVRLPIIVRYIVKTAKHLQKKILASHGIPSL